MASVHLIVRQPFWDYKIGDRISDPVLIALILASDEANYVIPVDPAYDQEGT